MKDLHPKKCEWCETEVSEILKAAELFVESPEGKLELAAMDIFEVNQATEKKQESWGF